MSSGIEVQNWGRLGFEEAWHRQKELVQLRSENKIGDQIIFVEHDAVITLGRASQRGERPWMDLAASNSAQDLKAIDIERGGAATYHGPGQLVVYPIIKMLDAAAGSTGLMKDLPFAKRGIVNLIRTLELWVIDFLQTEGLKAHGNMKDRTGVWVETSDPVNNLKKIASIGMATHSWVSYHGLSLNLSTGLDPWRRLHPCGFSSDVMTDLAIETQLVYSIEGVMTKLVQTFPKFFLSTEPLLNASQDPIQISP